jgi:selenide,water dikinase
MGPADLQQVLEQLRPQASHPELLVGLDKSDDAAVYRLNDRQAIVQTLDFFPPIVDDPYAYGAVAAANAMSDVYAMGGRVLFALNVAGFPRDFPREVIARIFQGGADKVAEAGAVIAGGHTVVDREPKYGLCVTGLVDPAAVTIKGGLAPADRLFLSKPLGTGVVATAGKAAAAEPGHLTTALDSMTRLNRAASEILGALALRACTDVTGFGLLGHGSEMLLASGAGMRLHAAQVPLLPGALEYARGGYLAGGMSRNRKYLASLADSGRLPLRVAPGVPPELLGLLTDSETSGGLLFSVPAARVPELRRRFAAAGEAVWEIGEVIPDLAIEIV